jgi:hypothetical protein
MKSSLNTGLSVPLTGVFLALGVVVVTAADEPLICTANSPPVVVPDVPNVDAAVGNGVTDIKVTDLAIDNDGDILIADPESTPQLGSAGGTLQAELGGTVYRYQPPEVLADDAIETFTYSVCDKHGACTDPPGTLQVNISAAPPAPPCDRIQGGPACFGQTWDGRWWTLDEEKQGQVSAPLFHPSKQDYLKPELATEPVIAIFSTPGGRESYWGCGADQSVVVASRRTCDPYSSLRSGITYMKRLAVANAFIPNSMLKITTTEMYDQYGSYFTALSKDPTTAIDMTDNTPSGEPAKCMAYGSSAGFYYIAGYGCTYLNPKTYNKKVTERLYLKIQVAPNQKFSSGKWTGTAGSQCDKTIDCRLYVNAW